MISDVTGFKIEPKPIGLDTGKGIRNPQLEKLAGILIVLAADQVINTSLEELKVSSKYCITSALKNILASKGLVPCVHTRGDRILVFTRALMKKDKHHG